MAIRFVYVAFAVISTGCGVMPSIPSSIHPVKFETKCGLKMKAMRTTGEFPVESAEWNVETAGFYNANTHWDALENVQFIEDRVIQEFNDVFLATGDARFEAGAVCAAFKGVEIYLQAGGPMYKSPYTGSIVAGQSDCVEPRWVEIANSPPGMSSLTHELGHIVDQCKHTHEELNVMGVERAWEQAQGYVYKPN